MNRITFILILLVPIMSVLPSIGQVGNLGSEEVTIVSDYQARIAEANKIEFVPQSPDAPQPDTNLEYQVPERLVELEYKPAELKPLGIPKEKAPKYHNSYIKLGFGNRITPLAELAYNETSLKNTLIGANFKHLSSVGKRENMRFSTNQAGAFVDHYVGMFKLEADFDFSRDVHHFYGYDTDSFSFDAKDVRQRIRTFNGGLAFSTAKVNKAKVDFSQSFDFRHTTDRTGIKEKAFVGESKFSKVFLTKHYVNTNFIFDLNDLDYNDSTEVKRNIYQIGANYTFNNDDWVLRAGLTGVVDDTCFFLFPEIYTSKRLFDHKLIFYSGWNRRLEKNTFASLVAQNPYMNTDFTPLNARVEDRYVGFKGTYKIVNYDIRFSNKVIKNMALFVNDSTDMKRFDIEYDPSLSLIDLHLGATVDVNPELNIGLTLDYFIYETSSSVARPWHLPTFQMNLFGQYNFKDKVLVRMDIISLAGAVARNADGSTQTIKGTADISLEGEYRFSEYLSFFCQLNNLAGIKYERYLNYPSFGFIGIVGARFSY